MRENRWKFTPVPLIFEESTGRLLDGQNRLTGVVKSGTTQTFMVRRNAQAHLMSAIDQGKARTASDHMKLEGIDQCDPDVAFVSCYGKVSFTHVLKKIPTQIKLCMLMTYNLLMSV